MMTGSPERGRAFGASAEGEHPGGRPVNQDAFGARVVASRATIAVADGHGSPTCFRSEIGSRYAVEIALALGERDVDRLGELELENAQVRFRRAIVDAWRERVLADIAANPFLDAEFDANAQPGREPELRALIAAEPTLAYGSTLLFAAADDEHIVYLQIGDGETIAVDADGTSRTIFPKPAAMLANETYSLCQDDAWQYVRIAVQQRGADEPAFVVAATDGFGNAFPSPNAARDRAAALGALLTESDERAREDLAALADASSAASLDDATLAVLVPPPRRARVPASAPAPQPAPPVALAPDSSRAARAVDPSRPVRSVAAMFGAIVVGACLGWFGFALTHRLPANFPGAAPATASASATPVATATASPAAVRSPMASGEALPPPALASPAVSPSASTKPSVTGVQP